jgi:hypothetical protein
VGLVVIDQERQDAIYGYPIDRVVYVFALKG